jgi:uncharacterized protein (DUF4415 family)
MSAERTVVFDPKKHKSKTDWARVRALTDADIAAAVAADPDAAPLSTEASWLHRGVLVLPDPKVPISIRIERAVLEWFKAQGPRYQTRMNAVLKSYAAAHGAGKERPPVKRGRR